MAQSMVGKNMLVVSAHPGDVLWRCSGAVAKHIKLGGNCSIIIVTYGIGGEANELMVSGMTIAEAKALRKRDLTRSAEILGADIEFWDMQDYRFEITQDKIIKLAKKMRKYKPDLILTHHGIDILNPDHGKMLEYVNMSLEVATGYGVFIEGTTPGLERAPIFCFEPHDSESNGFVPNLFVDITDVIEIKKAAMATCELKAPLAESYINRAAYRGQNASSFGRKGCKYAEAYHSIYPIAQDGYFVY